MQNETDENIFAKGTEEERKKKEAVVKRFTTASGVLLLCIAAVLFMRRSDYIKNQLALFKSAEEYYSYVELKNMEPLNKSLAEYYSFFVDEYERQGTLHTTENITIQAEAKALLAAFLKPFGLGTEWSGELRLIKQDDKTALTGEMSAEKTAYPLELLYDGEEMLYMLHPLDGEYFHIRTELPGNLLKDQAKEGDIKTGRFKKRLSEYETLFFDELAKGGAVLNKKVLRTVNDRSAFQKELVISLTKEELDNAVQAVLKEAEKDGCQEFLHVLFELTDRVVSLEMKLYVDNYGKLTGREVLLETVEHTFCFGYASVADGLSVGVEAYVNVNDTELFFADGIVAVEDGAVEGNLSLFVRSDDTMQEYKFSLFDVKVMEIVKQRFSGDIFITSDAWKGADVMISLSSTNATQECVVSVSYGNTEQLAVTIHTEETEPVEMPALPAESREVFHFAD